MYGTANRRVFVGVIGMKKALVTGANGFVGKWLVKELVDHQIEVFAVVKNEQSEIDGLLLPNVKILYCDLEHLDQIADQISDRDIDVLFHLGWAGSTGPDRADYALQLRNAKWTCDAVQLAQKMKIRRFVGAGTLAELDCSAYIGEDGSVPNAVSCYGSAKIAAHYMSKAIACKLGVEHVWAYLSNTYGVGNRTQNFVNFASNLMLSGKRAAFTSGEQPYDFVYVSDIAQALRLLGDKGHSQYAYYIGSGRNLQLKEYIKMIRDSIDSEIPLYLGEVPFHGKYLPKEAFDCQKLCDHTGYRPQISFEEGIRLTVAWLKTNRE